MKTLDKLKQEFLDKYCTFIEETEGYETMQSDLDQLLANLEQAKWKKYPENVPNIITTYLTTTEITFQSKSSKFVSEELWNGYRFNGNVIAFHELPEPFKPE